MFQNPIQVILLIVWTPPFLGMLFLLMFGGLLGLILSLESWLDISIAALGTGTVILFFLFPKLGIYIIPLTIGWIGFSIGRYYRLKAEIGSSKET